MYSMYVSMYVCMRTFKYIIIGVSILYVKYICMCSMYVCSIKKYVPSMYVICIYTMRMHVLRKYDMYVCMYVCTHACETTLTTIICLLHMCGFYFCTIVQYVVYPGSFATTALMLSLEPLLSAMSSISSANLFGDRSPSIYEGMNIIVQMIIYVCMYVCMYVYGLYTYYMCVYICIIYIFICVCMLHYIHIMCVYVCMYVCIYALYKYYVCMYACVIEYTVCENVCICMYVQYVFKCMYVYACICLLRCKD